MTTSLLATTTVSAEDFAGVSVPGRRMASSVISVGILEGLSHDFAREFLWEDGLPDSKERLYPYALVSQVFAQPVPTRWAIAAELCYGLAADEEIIEGEAA